ncbi:MAG: neutral/alkaline non-lysosomal ceramidase N-terminal domain-containing protein [Planctomycetes bacterium]|nr:neutral/alkaline non-lysosomal ceramidase N-terminal domain-containing protein [Planctomycetota bacterium]
MIRRAGGLGGPIPIIIGAIAFLAAAATTRGVRGAEASSEWKAGVASTVITPDLPVWLDGYAARDKPAEEKVHDLLAKALVIEDAAGTRFVIVSADILRIPREVRDAVAKEARERFGIAPENLLLNASHTHCGPMVTVREASLWNAPPEFVKKSQDYIAGLGPAFIDLIGRALDALAPARLSYAHARAGYAMNRRLKTDRGVLNHPNPDGPVDHDVPVLRIEDPPTEKDPGVRIRALLFGYACHATTLCFFQVCGDHPGFAQRYVEEAHPGTTALYLAGCGGDQNPYPRHGPDGLEYCMQHGRALANAVETALLARPRPVRGPLRAALSEIALPFASVPTREALESQAASRNASERKRAEALLAILERDGSLPASYPYLIQVVRFGDDLVLAALAGEVVVGYSLQLKAKIEGPAVWVAGYSNDVFGYVPTARILEEGGYEGTGSLSLSALTAPFDPSIETRILEEVHRLVAATRPGAAATGEKGGTDDAKKGE